MAGLFDAASVLQQAQQALTGQQNTNTAVANQIDHSTIASAKLIDLQKKQAEDRALANAENQQIITNLSTALGGNAAAQNYKETEWATVFQQETDAAIAKSKKVQSLDTTSFFDNPIGFISNQFQIEELNSEIKQHESTAKIAGDSLSKLHALESSGASSAIATSATLTAAGAAAQLRAKAADDQMLGLKTEIDTAARNINLLDAMAQGKTRELDIARKGFEVQVSEQDRALRIQESAQRQAINAEQLTHLKYQNSVFEENQQFKRDAEERNRIKFDLDTKKKDLDIIAKQLEIDKKEAIKETDPNKKVILEQRVQLNEQKIAKGNIELEGLSKSLSTKQQLIESKLESAQLSNDAKTQAMAVKELEQKALSAEANSAAKGFAALGKLDLANQITDMAVNNPQEWKRFSARVAATPEGKRILQIAITNGESGEVSKAFAGQNAGEALRILNDAQVSDTSNLHKNTQATINVLKDLANTSLKPASDSSKTGRKQTDIDKLSVAEKDQVVSNFIASRAAEWVANSEQAGSVYAAPKLGEFVNHKEVTNSALWQKVLMPIASLGGGDSSYKNISEKAVDAVRRGVISANDAIAGISTFYKAAIDINNATSGYNLVTLPNQTSYNITSEVPVGMKEQLMADFGLAPKIDKVKQGWVSNTRSLAIDASKPEQVTTDILLRLGRKLGE